MSRRIGKSAEYDLTLEELELFAQLLEVPVEHLAATWVRHERDRAEAPYRDARLPFDVAAAPTRRRGPRTAAS